MRKIYITILLTILMFFLCNISSNASEMTLYELEEKTDVKDQADTEAETITSLEAGTPVLVIEEEDGWVKIQYQDFSGYVQTELLGSYASQSGIDKEFDEIEETFDSIYKEIDSLQRKKVQEVLWFIIIIILIVMVIALGVVRLVRRNKESKEN